MTAGYHLPMELLPYTDADMWLLEAMETDPRVMAELGGPWPVEEIPMIHARRLAYVDGGSWNLKIIPEPGAAPVGTMMLWASERDGEAFTEAGWMLLPEHQGKGHAREALRLLLEQARADGRWGPIHAFPGVDNIPSNALCRGQGFTFLETVDVDYGDRTLHCNHWVLPA